MQTNNDGIEIIREFEGCWLKAYVCPAGKLTIGYGHTGPDVLPGMVITQEQAEQLLKQDIQKVEAALNGTLIIKSKLNQNQFSALVSFAFNLGIGALSSSTLTKKINAGDFKGAALEFERWVYGKNKEKLPGLVKRRAMERALFEKK